MNYLPTFFLSIWISIFLLSCNSTKKINNSQTNFLPTPFEHNENYSASYQEVIDYYTKLSRYSSRIKVNTFGLTDSGKPLHEVIISTGSTFDPVSVRNSGKTILLVNNGIHPGEPCGIDASMKLARDLVSSKYSLLDNVVVVIIPVYNIGGALNRGSFSRANQNGPEFYGFRGNAKNLDLNRDFIKCDSKNAVSFHQLFNKWNPDFFIDNHTSNGADYQYTITLIASQKDKLEENLSHFQQEIILPFLYSKMEVKNYEMTPYVYSRGTPDNGIAGFLDLPRYSSGYASLHNCFSFMVETHMLKPFQDRVESTYLFLESVLEFMKLYNQEILNKRIAANENIKIKESFDISWELDRTEAQTIEFKGYEAEYKKSRITGQDRLYYNRERPYTKNIPYFNNYKATKSISKPLAYIVPQAYNTIVEHLKNNKVIVQRIDQDTIMDLEVYRIADFDTSDNPYEGHYPHRNTSVTSQIEPIQLFKGDFIIMANQKSNRLIVETLEPEAPDSYFSWNYFDGILNRKEYFSSYVFEDLAWQLLKRDPILKSDFEKKKRQDKEFAQSSYQQLNFIYERSPHYERTFRRYPIYRLLK